MNAVTIFINNFCLYRWFVRFVRRGYLWIFVNEDLQNRGVRRRRRGAGLLPRRIMGGEIRQKFLFFLRSVLKLLSQMQRSDKAVMPREKAARKCESEVKNSIAKK